MSTPTVVGTKNDTLWEWRVVIGVGIFATGLAQPEVIKLPLQRFLRESLQVDVDEMSTFFFIASLPWSLKIFSGLLLDSVPLFHTRRFHYLIVGAASASAFWLALNAFHSSFIALAIVCFAINFFLVLASSAGGALFIEGGKRLNIMDQLISTRLFVDNANSVIVGVLAVWLAGISFAAYTVVGALIPLSLLPVVVFLLREPPTAKFEESVVHDGWKQIRTVTASHQVWAAGLLLLLIGVTQSFSSCLYFHQVDLKFTNLQIGLLQSLEGVGGIVAVLAYSALRRLQHLRAWLILGIFCSSLDAFLYTYYDSLQHAFPISLGHGFLLNLSSMAILEVIGLATPEASTALGFAFMASIWNSGIPIGDKISAKLIKLGFGFYDVVFLYAAISALAFGAVFLLPKNIQMSK